MYGKYDLPFHITQDDLSLSIERRGEKSYQYSRICREESVEKTLVLSKGDLLVHPVEPLNTPKNITPYLLIEFDKKLWLEPKATHKIFLSFPIEIAVLILLNKESKLIDSMSLTASKFTLYGEPNNGVICKYWKSGLHETAPSLNPFQEGLLELTVSNTTRNWEEVGKAVFNAYGMKLHYSPTRVAMKAKMIVDEGRTAETEFQDAAFERGMKKAQESYPARKLSMTTTTFTMENGL